MVITWIKERIIPGILILCGVLILTPGLIGCGGGGGGGSASTTDLILSWEPPKSNEDGTPLTDLAGYKIYYNTTSDDSFAELTSINIEDIGDSKMCSQDQDQRVRCSINRILSQLQVTLNVDDLYCFKVTAYDYYGNESDFSNEACK